MEHWVAFPKLGIQLTVPQSVVKFSLFGMDMDIRWYGLLIALGFALAVIYANVRAPKLGVDRDRMMDVVLVTAVVAVLCTRLYYVLFSDPAYYFTHPEKILAIWDGGLAIYGGIIGAFSCGFLMCRIKKISVRTMFDMTAVGFLIGQGIGRWGNFFNQEAYGANTNLPWGMTGDIIQRGINGEVADQAAPVHPTFLYESLWCLLGALVLHVMFVKAYRFRGQIFASYLMWYGAERVFVEGLRADSLMIGVLRVSQLVAIAAIVLGIALFVLLPRYDKIRTAQQQMDALLAEDTTEDTLTLQEDEEYGSDH